MHVRKQASQGERPAQAQPPSFSPSQLAPSGTRLPACAARSCRSPSSPALSPSQRPCLRHGDGLRGSRALSAVPVWAGQAVLECVFGSSGNICSVTALPRLLPRLPASGLAPPGGGASLPHFPRPRASRRRRGWSRLVLCAYGMERRSYTESALASLLKMRCTRSPGTSPPGHRDEAEGACVGLGGRHDGVLATGPVLWPARRLTATPGSPSRTRDLAPAHRPSTSGSPLACFPDALRRSMHLPLHFSCVSSPPALMHYRHRGLGLVRLPTAFSPCQPRGVRVPASLFLPWPAKVERKWLRWVGGWKGDAAVGGESRTAGDGEPGSLGWRA